MMGTRRVAPKLITSGASTMKCGKPPSKIATLVEVLREARRKETELQRLSKSCSQFPYLLNQLIT